MTPEELDWAIGREALRRWVKKGVNTNVQKMQEGIATIAARLAREGWMPPEPVDPDLIAVREIVAREWEKWALAHFPAAAASVDAPEATRSGKCDGDLNVIVALAAYKAGREAEAERAWVLVEPAEAIVNRAVHGTGSNDLRWPHILKAARRLEKGLTAYKAGKAAQ